GNTGFLLSSFRVEARGDPDRLSPEELKGLLNKPELLSVTERHTPSQAVAFWLPEAELEALELELGTEIRLKTRGDSPFILSLAKLQAGTVTHCHVVGDGQAGASWTEHVLAHRAQGGPGPEPRGQGDGDATSSGTDRRGLPGQSTSWLTGPKGGPALSPGGRGTGRGGPNG
uniref:Arpin n=1 Tax=Pelodiscus sinensis TaxID=13735 RepID=K7G328_PELSI